VDQIKPTRFVARKYTQCLCHISISTNGQLSLSDFSAWSGGSFSPQMSLLLDYIPQIRRFAPLICQSPRREKLLTKDTSLFSLIEENICQIFYFRPVYPEKMYPKDGPLLHFLLENALILLQRREIISCLLSRLQNHLLKINQKYAFHRINFFAR